MEHITSTRNPQLQEMRRLHKKTHREASGFCLVEGIQPCLRAIENGLHVEFLIYAPELLKSPLALMQIADLQRRQIKVLTASKEAFATISERDNPVGLALVAKANPLDLGKITVGKLSILTALFNVKNPGNLGTIVRTTDSIGGSGVILVGQTADPYDPTCIKASMGTVFSVPLARSTEEDFLAWCHDRQVALITTSAQATMDLAKAKFDYPCAVLMGSEGPGLPRDILTGGHWAVRIPMYGQANSLNLAVATGIILYEVRRQLNQN
ncbi:MAG: 23S rRNA (uridine(2479)-2'-O)-methyltransferase [Firmicutes bacterium]|nr:23S rRNA (uridine(2479)-2'-O)-methyltransferase [Bacillota bacterium]